MKIPKHKIHESTKGEGTYLEILEKLSTFIVNNHSQMQCALVILSADAEDKEPGAREGIFFINGDHNTLVDNLVLSISQAPEVLDTFVAAIIKGDLKSEFIKKVLLFEARELIRRKLQEHLETNPDGMFDSGIGPKDN